MASAKVERSGIGFPNLLTLLFIGLKLTNVIDWSWVWVLSPSWIPIVVIAAACLVLLLALAVKMVVKKVKSVGGDPS